MKNKFKLALIDEYIKIYKVLFLCKQLVLEGINKQMQTLFEYSKATLALKSKYESTFSKFGVDDQAFKLLKKELDSSINQTQDFPKSDNQVTLCEIWERLIEIEKKHNDILSKGQWK